MKNSISIENSSLPAITSGRIDRIWKEPRDSLGRRCGVDRPVENLPLLAYLDISRCMDPWVALYGCQTTKICVGNCTTENWWIYPFSCNDNGELIYQHMYCQVGYNWTNCNEFYQFIQDEICGFYLIQSDRSKKKTVFFSIFLMDHLATLVDNHFLLKFPHFLPFSPNFP